MGQLEIGDGLSDGEAPCGCGNMACPGDSSHGLFRPERVSPEQPESATLRRVRIVLAGHLGLDPGTIAPGADLLEDLNLDPLDRFELLMLLEEIYQTELPDEAAENCDTVADLAKIVDEAVLHSLEVW